MYFLVKCAKNPRKTQGVRKNLEKTQGPQDKTQEPKIGSKNPRSCEKTQGVATLLRFRPKGDNVGLLLATSLCLKPIAGSKFHFTAAGLFLIYMKMISLKTGVQIKYYTYKCCENVNGE